MSIVKKWSTGKLGNNFPDHSDRGNPNTKGLTPSGNVGIEGYIEEDKVVANQDNRPLQNLAQNDVVLENNLSDVASEVDYGILKNRYNEFELEILDPEFLPNPEDENETIEITPLRIHSGSSFVNGSVVRTGNQKIIYFLKDDGSYLFPDYVEYAGKNIIEISDKDYFGSYKPVYDTESDQIPDDFQDFEIKITNSDSTGTLPDRHLYFSVYRDWEDIVPFAPQKQSTSQTINFLYDSNYGQGSEGIWLTPESDYINIKTSDVEMKKDLTVNDKYFDPSEFKLNPGTGRYETRLITDNIFFENIEWESGDVPPDIKDIYVDNNDNIYFIYDPYDQPGAVEYNLFKIATGSNQFDQLQITPNTDKKPLKLKKVGDILFILGEQGLLSFYNPDTQFSLNYFDTFNSSAETFIDIILWDNQLWVATDKKLYYTDYKTFIANAQNPGPTGNVAGTFIEINLETEIASIAGSSVLETTTGIYQAEGNYVIESSLTDDVKNYIQNPSFEDGGINNTPTHWDVESVSGNATFRIRNTDTKYGAMKGLLKGTVNDTAPAFYQYIDQTFSPGDDWTFSIYLKAASVSNVELEITEYDEQDATISSTSSPGSVPATNVWTRFSHTHTISSNDVSYIEVKVKNHSPTVELQVDGAQLEFGQTANQFVYGFNYLFIGFEKKNDSTNPPYALIDARKKYLIQYHPNVHGMINRINTFHNIGNNEAYIADNTHIYSIKFLNSIDSYDRITVSEISEQLFGSDFKDRVNAIEDIEELDGKYYLGATILNKNISFIIDDRKQHEIEFIEPEQDMVDQGYLNFLDLIGPYKIVQATDIRPFRVEFERTQSLVESRLTVVNEGSYIPDKTYRFGIVVDPNDPVNRTILYYNVGPSPTKNNTPWEMGSVYATLQPDVENPTTDYNIVFNYETSTTEIDGFYSFGRNYVSRLVRGNIHRIFRPQNTYDKPYNQKYLYIARDNTIFKTKYDANIKKIDNRYPDPPFSNLIGEVDAVDDLPVSAGDGNIYYVTGWGYFRWNGTTQQWEDTQYFYRWPIYHNGHVLTQYCKIANRPVTFDDTTHNQYYMDLPVDPGYELLHGSIRVKVNEEVEYGFVENEDYFVDYENKTIIRNNGENFLSDPEFKFISEPDTDWSVHSDGSDYSFITKSGYADTYINNTATTTFLNIYQLFTPSSVAVGDTYTFSIYINSNIIINPIIRVSECISTNTTTASPTSFGINFDYTTRSTVYTEELGGISQLWKRIEVTHTVSDSNSDTIRIEFEHNSDYQVQIKQAQLEYNPYATPFIHESFSRIDPNATVYCDFVQYKILEHGVDYVFNQFDSNLNEENRKIELFFNPSSDDELYLNYVYEKTFNPYRFGNSIPKVDVSFDSRDDYFLYQNSGRIWAIDPILTLLSFDNINPITVNYSYHFPRIDKIKIRNQPDQFGNFLYIVKGDSNVFNPYSPEEDGYEVDTHIEGEYDLDIEEIDERNNEALYEINVVDYDFDRNDIYDRRIFIESETSPYYSISLREQTLAYIPFVKDFVSTGGIHPVNKINSSRIVSIIKNYSISQNQEVGAWSSDYNINLRYKDEYPQRIGPSFSTFVDAENGDDGNDGSSDKLAFKTIKKAVDSIEATNGTRPHIVVVSESTIYEDLEINLNFEISIRAKTFFIWQGNIQNRSTVSYQGIVFKNFNHYVLENCNFYHCDFLDSSVNNYYPLDIKFYNCKIQDVHNTFLSINNQLFPSPFVHPYMKSTRLDDGVQGSPEGVATSDDESIHPNEVGFNYNLTANPSGNYEFLHCLINRVTEDLVNYDIESEDWRSFFNFERCTIVNGENLFRTKNIGQSILFNESILWNNGFLVSDHKYYFDSRSNIEFLNSFIDFSTDPTTVPSDELNYDSRGNLLGRRTCAFSGSNTDPGFVETERDSENYHLKSIAKGFLRNSVNIGKAADGSDIGAYDELRERTDVDIPQKFKSNFAYIEEAIQYPIIINSEKVTFTIEFKPIDQYNVPGILFDTRSNEFETDYIVVSYNNNIGEYATDIYPNENSSITNPYTFKIVVANRISKFVVVSPIEIESDSAFQQWHKISFTVNYEKVFNQKPSFDEKDKYQNIITFYHNEQLAVESFINYDLNRDTKGELLEENIENSRFYEFLGNDIITNAWNYNDISDFITIAAAFNNNYTLKGYYSELRIDNRFVDRKELAAWNNKILPFVDPDNYVDQSTLARTFQSEYLNEFWSLRSKYGVGAKGNVFEDKTQKRFDFESGELVWALTQPTENLFTNADFADLPFVKIVADVPPRLNGNISNKMIINTTNSRQPSDNNGVEIRFYDDIAEAQEGMNFYSAKQLIDHLNAELYRTDGSGQMVNGNSYIRFKYGPEGKLIIYTTDWRADSLTVKWENSGDPIEMGFDTFDPWYHNATITEYNVNVVFVDTMRTDQYTPDGTPSWPYTSFTQASENIESGEAIKVVSGETLAGGGSTYEDFDVDLGQETVTLEGSQITITRDVSITVEGLEDGSQDAHEVWPYFDPYFSRFGETSIGVKKLNYLDNVPIKIWFEKKTNQSGSPVVFLEDEAYVITVYIYSVTPIVPDDIRLLVQQKDSTVEVEFDSYETTFGYWRKLESKVHFIEDPDSYDSSEDLLEVNDELLMVNDTFIDYKSDLLDSGEQLSPDFGIIIKRDFECYIDGVQIEQSEFSSPFVKNANDKEGVIEIDKSLVSSERGIIFFRFKPMIGWEYEEEVVLLEMLKYKQDEDGNLIYENQSGQETNYPQLDPLHGFRVTYYYDRFIRKGVLTIKTNNLDQENDDSTERFFIVENLWDMWHSFAIHYDHLTQRFIYFFDHYKRTIDSSAIERAWGSNLFIGRDVPKNYNQNSDEFSWTVTGYGENENKPSANIYVKDVIITNYPVSPVEIENWQNTEEFYKESSILHVLETYQADMQRQINQLSLYATESGNIATIIEDFESKLAGFNDTLTNTLETTVHNNEVTLANHETRLINVEVTSGDNETTIENTLIPTQQNHTQLLEQHRGVPLSSPISSSISNNYSLITDETNQRIDAIDTLKGRLSLYPSNESSDGAAFIGVQDVANHFSANNVEDVLAEVYAGTNTPSVLENNNLINLNTTNISELQTDVAHLADGESGSWTRAKAKNNRWNIANLRTDVDANAVNISNNESAIIAEQQARETADQQIRDDFASTDSSFGASLIGVEDSADNYTSTTVESVLTEIAGLISTNATEISNNDTDISNIQTDISNINTDLLEVGKVKDGADGSTWDVSMNLKSHNDRLDTAESDISTNASNISTNSTDISNTLTYAQGVQSNLDQEIIDRQDADTAIRNDLASKLINKGASLVGVYNNTLTSNNVEDALIELHNSVQTLENNLNWKYAVNTQADLPGSDNEIGDARTVLDDGDGFAAQYVWNGTEWVKIADINWGTATDIAYDNSGTKLESTSVQAAITEVYQRSKDPTKAEDDIDALNWSAGGDGRYFYDVQHELETGDVTILPISKATGQIVGVDEIETIDPNVSRVWTTDDSEGLDFVVFGALHSYAKVVGSWTVSGAKYYHDIEHNLGTSKLMISLFDIYSGHRVNLDEIEFVDDNTIRLWSTTNTIDINVFVLKRTSETKIKDIDNWSLVSGMYETEIRMAEDYDAIFSFIEPSTGVAVEVDDVWFDNGFLKIRSTDNNRLRLIILK